MLSMKPSKGIAASEPDHLRIREMSDKSLRTVGVLSDKFSLNRKISAFDSFNSIWSRESAMSNGNHVPTIILPY
jgi:hypothetical protein